MSNFNNKKIGKKSFHKWKNILIPLLVGTVSIAAITTPLIHFVQQASSNLGSNTDNAATNKLLNVFNDPSVVIARRDAILTKMAKEIAYMDLSKGKTDETIRNDVQKQAGAFLYNVQQQYAEGMAVERKSNQNNYSTPVNDIKYEYHLLNAEAKKMGVDVYDTTVAQAAKDSFLLKMRNTLSSASYTPDQINTLLDQLGATYDSDVKASIIGSWDSFNFTVQLNNDVQNIISTNHGEHVSAQVQSDTQRTTALSYIQNNLHDLLNVNIDTTTFNALLPDYSPNGKYNVNDEIDPEDFPKLFSFDYNRLAGASFASINLSDIGIDVNNLVSGPDGNYDPKLKLTETLPFDTYSGGYGGEYRQGEFLPGYTLHCKILQKDVTDSHICSLQILLGVSATTDKDPNDVTWTVLDKDNLDKGSPFKLDLKITDLDQLKYITTHQYFLASDVIIDPTKYDTTNDSFYNPGTDKDQNPRLDFATLLEKYMQKDTNNDYIIDADHPVFIDPADLGGIDLPTDIDPALLIDNAFHNHQSLKLEVTDVNTNPPLNDSGGGDLHGFSVKGHWVIYDDNDSENHTADQTTVGNVVKDYKWSYNNDIKDDIWIQFFVSQADLDAFTLGYNIEGAFAMMQFMQDTLHACQDSEVVKEYDKIDSDRVVCIGSNSTLAAMAGVDVASSIAASVAAALNGGPSLSVSLMINAAIAAAFIGYMGIEIDTLVDARNSHGEWINTINKIEAASQKVSAAFAAVGGSILGVYDNVMEPKKDFTIKGKACQFVQNELISVDSGEPFNQFVIDILQALSGDTLTNSEIADALNSLSKGLTDGAAWGFDAFKFMSIAAGAYVTEGIFFFVGTGGTTMSKAIDTFISRYWHNFPKIRLTYTNNISEALSENLKSWIESSKSCVNSIAKKICCKKQDVDEVVKGVRYQELDSCSFHSEHNPISADEGGLSGAAVRRATDDAAEAAARYAAAAPASTRSAYWGSGIGLIISTIFFGALITTATLTGKCADDILAKLDNSIGNNNDIADKYTIDSNNIYSFKNNQVGDEIKMTVTTTTDGKPVDIKDVDKIEWSINENSLPYIRLSDAHNSSTTTLKLILVPPVDVKVLLTVAISTKTGKHYIAQFAFNITVTS